MPITNSPTTNAATMNGYVAKDFNPVSGLKALGGLFGYGLAMSALYATTGVGVPCPFRSLTGWNCPLCGGTRMGRSLLELDLVSAFRYNPLALVALVLLGVLGVLWTVEVLGGPKVRPPAALGARLKRVHPTRWSLIGLAVAVVYTLARNLV